jgi:hypothetical protein
MSRTTTAKALARIRSSAILPRAAVSTANSAERVLHGIVWAAGRGNWGLRSSLPQKKRIRER